MPDEFAALTARTLDDWETWVGRNVDRTEEGVTLARTPTLSADRLGVAARALDVHPNGNVGVVAPTGGVEVLVEETDEIRPLSLRDRADAAVPDPDAVATTGSTLHLFDADAGRLAGFSRRLRRLEWAVDCDVDPVTVVGSQRRVYVLDADGAGGSGDANEADGSEADDTDASATADDSNHHGAVRVVDGEGDVETVLDGVAAPRDLSVADDDTLFVLEGDPDVRDATATTDAESGRDGDPTNGSDYELLGDGGAMAAVAPADDPGATADYRLLRLDADVGEFSDPTPVEPTLPDGFVPQAVAAQTTAVFVFAGVNADDEWCLVRYDATDDEAREVASLDGPVADLVSGRVGDAGREDRVYCRLAADGTVVRLDERYDNRKDPENTRYEGRVVGYFDAGGEGTESTQWHRATLDIDRQSQNTRVDVRYYAADEFLAEPHDRTAHATEFLDLDDLVDLPGLEPHHEEQLEAAGVDSLGDLLEHDVDTLAGVVPRTPRETVAGWVDTLGEQLAARFDARSDVAEAHDPADTLFEDASGRYLHVEVRFVGSRTSSPRLNSLTAYCPRKSYIRYLPEIYREQARSSPFLSQFLSIFESVFVDLERTLDGHTKYLDPETIPADYLSWLNGWLALELGETWPESARRELLDRAPELYKRRGTRGGIETLIDLYFDHVEVPTRSWDRALVETERRLEALVEAGHRDTREAAARIEALRREATATAPDDVYVFEHHQLDWMDDGDRRDDFERLIGHGRQFQVLLQPSVPEEHVRAVREIVDSEQPVYADADVRRLPNRYQLEGNTYLGINTVLPKRSFEIGTSSLGQQTRLGRTATDRTVAGTRRTRTAVASQTATASDEPSLREPTSTQDT